MEWPAGLSTAPARECATAGGNPLVQFGEGLGVLVVDDDRVVGAALELWLERTGFEVWSADSGTQAIDVYRAYGDSIAVVLLDVRTPGLDGLQTLDRLRELNPKVLTCVMSGAAAAYDPNDLLQHGAVSVIAKPFRLEELTNALRFLVRGVPTESSPSGRECQK
jgi:DNA-binding response OmpR family regulator